MLASAICHPPIPSTLSPRPFSASPIARLSWALASSSTVDAMTTCTAPTLVMVESHDSPQGQLPVSPEPPFGTPLSDGASDTETTASSDNRTGTSSLTGSMMEGLPDVSPKTYADGHASVSGESMMLRTSRLRSVGAADPFALRLHLKEEEEGKYFVARLMPNSRGSITIKIDAPSFNKMGRQQDAEYTSRCLVKCVDILNSADIGIQFECVAPDQPANFTVSFQSFATGEGPDNMRTLARSFFPGDGKSVIFVYRFAFEGQHRDRLAHTLCHELAHTLGMRHSNAGKDERYLPSVSFPDDSKNEPSIMYYYNGVDDLELTQLDGVELKAFYALEEGEYIDGFPVRDFPPSPPT